jgi:hypothetical protein
VSIYCCCYGVGLFLWNWAANGPIVREWIWSSGGIILTGENRRTRRRTCPSATLCTTNSTWTVLSANPGLRGEKPATNRLSYAITRVCYLNALLCQAHYTRFYSGLFACWVISYFYVRLTIGCPIYMNDYLLKMYFASYSVSTVLSLTTFTRSCSSKIQA